MDPTAPDIHLGHTVVLNKLRQFQDAGHEAVLIIGDYTARIGDPSGRSKTRPRLDPAVIDANAITYQEQAFLILDDDPAKLEIRFNGEWLGRLTMEQLFEITATTTVARILERDDFAKRWAAHQPISMLEMLYPLAQGYDSVAINADIELGGTDQKFNLFMGRDLQEYFGQPAQTIMTMDILPGTDGVERMSKSTGNYVGVTEDPRDIYGKIMSIPDATMMSYYRLLTSHHADELARLEQELAEGAANPRDMKARLAREIIVRLHGAEAAAAAEDHFERVFRRHEAAGDLQALALQDDDLEDGTRVPAQGHGALVRPDPLGVAAPHPAGRRDPGRRAGHGSGAAGGPARRAPHQGGQVGALPGPHQRPLSRAGAPPARRPGRPPQRRVKPSFGACHNEVDTPS